MMEDARTCAISLSVKDGASSMSEALVTASAVRARFRGAAGRRGAAIARHSSSCPRGGPRQPCVKRIVILTVYPCIDVDPLFFYSNGPLVSGTARGRAVYNNNNRT